MKGYRDGTADLMVASMVTEVAFHLMEDIERGNLFPKINGKEMNPVDVARAFFEQCCYLRGQPAEVRPGPMWDVAQWLCLKPDIHQCTTGDPPIAQALQGCYGTCDLSAGRAQISDWNKYCEDCTILAHTLTSRALL